MPTREELEAALAELERLEAAESDDDDDEISRIVRGTGQHRDPPTRPSSRMNNH